MRSKVVAPTALPSGCWGKLNRGQRWFPMAIDFGRAVSVANLGGYERMLIHIIQERSWGKSGGDRDGSNKWPKAMPVPLTMPALAVELAGEDDLTRKMIYRARKTLLESAVIRERDGGMVIETDISKWIDRIDPKFFNYCMEGRTKQGPKPAPKAANESTADCHLKAANLPLKVTASEDACHVEIPPCRVEMTDRNFKVASPIDEAHAEEDFQKREEDLKRSEGAPESNGSADVPEDGEHPVLKWSRQFGPAVAFFVEGNLEDGVDPEWLRVLIERKVVGQPSMGERRLLAYLSTILADWKAAGECEYLNRRAKVSGAWAGGVQPLTAEVVAGRTAKIREIIDRMPRPAPPPALSVVPEPERPAVPPQDMARLAAEMRARVERMKAEAPKRGALRA